MAAKKANHDRYDLARRYMIEQRQQVNRLEKVFQQTLGKRTLRLIQQIGITEIAIVSSNRKDTFSNNLEFQLPNYDTAHMLSFAVAKESLVPALGRGRVLSLGARLHTKGMMIKHDVSRRMFTHGTSVAANDKWSGRKGVMEYEGEIKEYMNLLSLGEGLVAGRSIESLVDYLPAMLSDVDKSTASPSGEDQVQWPTLQLPSGSRMSDPDDEI